MRFPLKICAILVASTHLSFLPFCQHQHQQQEDQFSIMSPIHERTYIMVKVRSPHPLALADLLTTRTVSVIWSHRSPTVSSEVSLETSSIASRSAVSNSSPSNSSTLPPHISRSVSPVDVVHTGVQNSCIWICRLRRPEGKAFLPWSY